MQPFMDVNNDEDSLEHDGDGRWPFRSFFEQLILDIFDPGKQFFPPSIVLFLVGVGGGGGGEGVVGSQDRSFIRVIMLLILIISLNFKC